MATRGIGMTVAYVAWDTTNNVGKTGDVANHTLKWVKDGTSSTATNSPAEVDSTNAPGLYKITLTSTETGCDIGVLAGKSSTSNVSIIPVLIQFERLPDAAPNAAGGLLTFGSSTGQINPSGGKVPSTLAAADVSGNLPVDVIAISGDTTAADNAELMFNGTGYAGGTVKLKVDLETIKTQAVTCAAGVTVYAHVGTSSASTAQTGDAYAIVNHVTYGNSAIKTLIDTVDDYLDTEITAIKTKTDYLPSATAGASGGLLIAGSNAATTFATFTSTGDFSTGDFFINGQFYVDTNFEVNGALLVSGGTTLAATATGVGLTITGGATSGKAVNISATVGPAVQISATSGYGIYVECNDNDAVVLYTGAGAGLYCFGTSHGAYFRATTGTGLYAQSASGTGAYFVGGTGYGLRLSGSTKDLNLLNTSTDMVLAKTTNITGFNDIAATAIVSGGAITTNSGAVSTVTTVNGLAANTITAASMHSDASAEIATTIWANATRTVSSATNITSTGGTVPISADGLVEADAIAIHGSEDAAMNQSAAARVVFGSVITGATTTTTLIDSALTQSDNNHWVGRVVIFLTGSLKYQATDITGFDASLDRLTFTALTSSPSGGDEYLIV